MDKKRLEKEIEFSLIWTIVNKVDKKRLEKEIEFSLIGRESVVVRMRSVGVIKTVNIRKNAELQ